MEENGLHARLCAAAGERTYRQLGKMTGTHPESVRRYMQGQSPSVEFLTRFCAALEINGSWLLTGAGPMNDHDVQPHALRTADTPDLLRALSDTVSVLIRRVDRLERLVQSAETRLRVAESGPTGHDTASEGVSGDSEDETGDDQHRSDAVGDFEPKRAPAPADRIGAALPKRPPGDASRDAPPHGA